MKEAARRLDKSGRVSPNWVRRRLKELDLSIVVLSNKHFVEPATLDELLEKCRVNPSDPASTSASGAVARPYGVSVTDRRKSSQAAGKGAAKLLKERSTNTG